LWIQKFGCWLRGTDILSTKPLVQGVNSLHSWFDSIISIADSLWAGRSGDRNLVDEKFSASVQTGLDAHPASHTMGTWSFPGVKRPRRGDVKEGVELHPLWAFMACSRVALSIYLGLKRR
jgi:hypothetical protein